MSDTLRQKCLCLKLIVRVCNDYLITPPTVYTLHTTGVRVLLNSDIIEIFLSLKILWKRYPNVINILLYEIAANFGLWFKQHILCFVETTLGRSDSLWLSPPPKNIVFRKQMFYICTCQFQIPHAMTISCKQCPDGYSNFPFKFRVSIIVN